MNLPQLIISVPLLFVLFFGLGFILNMILKTTWVPLIIYFGLVIYVIGGLHHVITAVNIVLFGAGLLGVLVGIWGIKTLRVKGYRMF